ncbi:MAG: hypothetical protein HY078_06665 [Elusimicrobia bacterium]|nr:hypothetical protein [Elusimicrobiota bacterium]
MKKPSPRIRRAVRGDLPAIVALLADDPLGRARERTDARVAAAYARAFRRIQADRDSELWVACLGREIIGTLQVTYVPNLTLQGTTREQTETISLTT